MATEMKRMTISLPKDIEIALDSANALSPTGSRRSAGKAQVTAISKGAKYPYHLIGEKNGSNVYGWVASKDISQ